STGWSCGAAALAWAARLKGRDVSERQMAELAVTAPVRGTKIRGMLRALHALGLEATARRRATWDDVLTAPTPVIVGWKLSRTVGHFVVVLEVDDGQVTVGDPLAGEQQFTRQEFLGRWSREMIVIR
ncbi:MAG: cysteine peptidase family C39 domain-containing protein, partial [Armatimonadota bacterium]